MDHLGKPTTHIVSGTKWVWVFIALFLILVFFSGLGFALDAIRPWSGVPGGGNQNPDKKIDVILRPGLTNQGQVKADFSQEIAWFRVSPVKSTSVWVFETSFGTNSLSAALPHKATNTLLVNSVDQEESISGGISGLIGRGCRLDKEGASDGLAPGDMRIHPCKGDYAPGITDVANVAIVTWSPDRQLDRPACFSEYNGPDQERYRACILRWVNEGVQRVLNAKNKSNQAYDAIILPALGTGTGRLDKADFYRTFFRVLETQLQNGEGSDLPRNIYLQVWTGDEPKSFARTIDGVRDGAQQAVQQWTNFSHKGSWDGIYSITGIAGGIAVLLIASRFSRQIQQFAPQLEPMLKTPSFLKLLALVIISYGLAEGISHLLPPCGEYDGLVRLTIGFIGAFASGPLSQAQEDVNDRLRNNVAGT